MSPPNSRLPVSCRSGCLLQLWFGGCLRLQTLWFSLSPLPWVQVFQGPVTPLQIQGLKGRLLLSSRTQVPCIIYWIFLDSRSLLLRLTLGDISGVLGTGPGSTKVSSEESNSSEMLPGAATDPVSQSWYSAGKVAPCCNNFLKKLF